MKRYRLALVEYQGKTYSKCSVTLEEEAGRAEVQRPAGLGRRKPVTIVSFSYDARTAFSVEGKVIKIDSLKITADDESEAAELERIVRQPAELQKQTVDGLAESERMVAGFLKTRADVIAFLIELRKDPRDALFGLSRSWNDQAMNPLDDYLAVHSKQLSDWLEEMSSTFEKKEWRIGKDVVERMYAFVFAVGFLQDKAFYGNENPDAILNSLKELGVNARLSSDAGVEAMTETLLASSHTALFSIIDQPHRKM